MNSYNLGANSWWPPPQAAAEEYVKYSEEYDKERSLREVDSVINGAGQAFLGADSGASIAKFMRHRIEHKIPTSLIRLGDADGNVLFSAMKVYPQLTEYNLRKISRIYFGTDSLMPDHREFFCDIVTEAVREADLIGGPERGTVEKSFNTPLPDLDVRGMCGMRGVYNYLAAPEWLEVLKSKAWGSTWFSRSLLPHYFSLTGAQEYVGFITCYPELAGAFQEKARIGRTETILVPMQASIAKSNKDIRHYPEAYPKIMEQIRPPYQGAIYIVAAGILSKSYCTLIKQRGGIAIDVGSTADIWMGNKSRPGMEQSMLARWGLFGASA